MKALDPIRFLLELCLVAALAVAGASISWWAAILLPLLLCVIWGLWIAPKATRRLTDPARLALEIVLFVGGGLALAAAGHRTTAIVLAAASIIVAVGLRVSDRE